METKTSLKLSLKKETITKLSNQQMKKIVGGLAAANEALPQSCNKYSCNSVAGASCGQASCSCPVND